MNRTTNISRLEPATRTAMLKQLVREQQGKLVTVDSHLFRRPDDPSVQHSHTGSIQLAEIDFKAGSDALVVTPRTGAVTAVPSTIVIRVRIGDDVLLGAPL